MDEFEKFYNKALKFLSYRPRSEKEIRDKLRRVKNKKNATTEVQKEQETQNFSVSKNLSDSEVAKKVSEEDSKPEDNETTKPDKDVQK